MQIENQSGEYFFVKNTIFHVIKTHQIIWNYAGERGWETFISCLLRLLVYSHPIFIFWRFDHFDLLIRLSSDQCWVSLHSIRKYCDKYWQPNAAENTNRYIYLKLVTQISVRLINQESCLWLRTKNYRWLTIDTD